MPSNEATVRALYDSLGRKDGDAMAACYATDATFGDPVFPDLKGRSVFVTGGGSGIGAALTEAFLRQGAKVAFCQRSDGTALRVAGSPVSEPLRQRDGGARGQQQCASARPVADG